MTKFNWKYYSISLFYDPSLYCKYSMLMYVNIDSRCTSLSSPSAAASPSCHQTLFFERYTDDLILEYQQIVYMISGVSWAISIIIWLFSIVVLNFRVFPYRRCIICVKSIETSPLTFRPDIHTLFGTEVFRVSNWVDHSPVWTSDYFKPSFCIGSRMVRNF